MRCPVAFNGLILLTLVAIFLQTQPSVAAGPQQLLLSGAKEKQQMSGLLNSTRYNEQKSKFKLFMSSSL